MRKAEATQRIKRLRELINDYRYQYHVLDHSTMSEAAADSLKHELTQLETEFPELITSDSPSQRVAGKVSERFKSVRHGSPMLSLNDVFSREEVEAWAARCQRLLGESVTSEYYAEIKMDGLAAAIVYEDGLLVQGITRGDGQAGEDVTANLRTVETIPLRLRHDVSVPQSVYQGRFEVRGEVLLYKKDFAALNRIQEKLGKPLFANPRNTAAGSIRQLDPSLTAARRLSFHVYGVPTAVPGISTHASEHDLAHKLGFKVEPHSQLLKNVDEIMKFAERWAERRKSLPYGTDGLVASINAHDQFARLGVVGKAPRGAVAYKFAAEQATTRVKDIQISIGRTGAATPFAVLEPTLVAGSTIQMATLHNESEVHRKDIRVGDTVIIQKAGDVIPEVVQSLPKLRTGKEKIFKMPTHCPICGTKLEKGDTEAVWRCPNFNCYALERGRIIHYASKDALDIEGLGEQTVDALLESKLIADPADLYHLTVDDVAGMPRFAEVSATNLVKAIQDAKKPTLDRFIYGLGIRHVGAQTARDLAAHFGKLEAFEKTNVDELTKIEGIGKIVAEAIMAWQKDKRQSHVLEKLAREGVRPETFQKIRGKLSGQEFVITGTLDSSSREVAGEKIVALGGAFKNAVTKDTTYLVVGADAGASKIKKADKLGTQRIDEAALLKLLK